MLVATVATLTHQYFQQTGALLDYGSAVEWISGFDEIAPRVIHGTSLSSWILLLAALLYTALGPWLVTYVVDQRREGTSPSVMPQETYFPTPLGLFFLASFFGFLSLLNGFTTLGRDPFINVVLTGFSEQSTEEDDSYVRYAAVHASLVQTPRTEKRNVVLIHLESTRARSVTPYNEDLKTTPFLNELAKKSLLVERAYVVVPRSSKGSVAVNCGIDPPLYPGPEFEPGRIPAPCLAGLLKKQGYSTVFFASTSNGADDFGNVVEGFGYEELYPAEIFDTENFQETNTFGWEDDIMLRPSEEWLKTHGHKKPFLIEYFTGTGHYGYECMSTRHGTRFFSEDDELNRYHNCLRLQDIFLKNLFDQYKQLRLYEDTIFVLFGDHGEGFGEHDRFLHGDTIYEEGLRVPLIIHDPKRFQNGERVEGLASQIDVLPTVLELLGYEVKDGEYPGYSLLRPLPEDRTLMFSCISSRECLASLKGTEKYIYHYGHLPEEFFDLSKDPLEKRNLLDERDDVAALARAKEVDKRRQELLAWRTRVNAEYGNILINGSPHSEGSIYSKSRP
jgi:arylsulfatase A-like enzyme